MQKTKKHIIIPTEKEWLEKGYYGITGFTTEEGIILDLDNTTLEEAKKIAFCYLKEFKLQGFIIMKSSKNNYHVIFDKVLKWKSVVSILSAIMYDFYFEKHDEKPHLTKWIIQQFIKCSETVRLNEKGKKPIPKFIYEYGKQQGLINSYIENYSETNKKKRIF